MFWNDDYNSRIQLTQVAKLISSAQHNIRYITEYHAHQKGVRDPRVTKVTLHEMTWPGGISWNNLIRSAIVPLSELPFLWLWQPLLRLCCRVCRRRGLRPVADCRL